MLQLHTAQTLRLHAEMGNMENASTRLKYLQAYQLNPGLIEILGKSFSPMKLQFHPKDFG